jgi:hypothetical protein
LLFLGKRRVKGEGRMYNSAILMGAGRLGINKKGHILIHGEIFRFIIAFIDNPLKYFRDLCFHQINYVHFVIGFSA